MRSSFPSIQARATLRREIDQQVRDYLNRGGRIEVLASGQSGLAAPVRSSGSWREDPLLEALAAGAVRR